MIETKLINQGYKLITTITLISILLFSGLASAFPENVRYGYASCSTCHVSPTGGGALTDYGQGASEEFMSTWFFKNENQPFHGYVNIPKNMIVGGDVRALAFTRDAVAFKENRAFPMQVELEVGARLTDQILAIGSVGFYDSDLQTQSHYVMTNVNDNVYARLGRFFPAFGIRTPEHAIATRKGLGFNQGRESYNLEAGFIGEKGEIIVDAILRSGQFALGNEERGWSLRTAWYVGNMSQIGVSAYGGRGLIWDRQIYGLFAIAGLTKEIYILSEIDHEIKKPTDKDDPSTPVNKRLVTYNKIGWEFSKGIHLFASYDSSVPQEGEFDPRFYQYGPGLQWIPRPHLEFTAQGQLRYDETWSRKLGNVATLMLHYRI